MANTCLQKICTLRQSMENMTLLTLNMLQRGRACAGKAEPLTCITNLITNQIYRDCYTLMTNIEQ